MKENNSGIEYLDCTIRDGGYRNNWFFSKNEVFDCYKAVSDAGMDYFEIGFMRKVGDPRKGRWYSTTLAEIQDMLNFHRGCKISVMVSVEGNEGFFLPRKEISMVDLVRIHLRVGNAHGEQHKIKSAFKMAMDSIESGHEATLNLASADKLSPESIASICRTFVGVPLKAIYIADTFGNMNEESTAEKISLFRSVLDSFGSSIPIGFHPHNNLGNALAKSKSAISNGVKMLDMTVLGLGRGAGNLRSEFFAMDQEPAVGKLDVLSLMRACDCLNPDEQQRKTIIYAITSKFNIHPKYEASCENKSLEDSYLILADLEKRNMEDSE